MKQIELIATASNFSAANIGKLSELNDYVLQLGPDVKIPGKVFGGAAIGRHRWRFLIPGIPTGYGNRIPAYPQKARGTILFPQRTG